MASHRLIISSPRVSRQRTGAGLPDRRPSWVVPPDLEGPGRARQITRQQLLSWRLDEHSDTAELLVSELVTNAVTHGAGPVTLSLSRRHGTLLCEVTDGHAALPQLRPQSPDSESGRGLQLLDMLARQWGVRSRGRGKTVWFELATCTARDCCR
ncbi:ATP-binding protein [Streptomyces sp. 7N604]|uniref:ATP-binding protein n=1 Tax=Streptomyces sp. 7N604 TaxID=3457415 RepID=UPI003FD01C3E